VSLAILSDFLLALEIFSHVVAKSLNGIIAAMVSRLSSSTFIVVLSGTPKLAVVRQTENGNITRMESKIKETAGLAKERLTYIKVIPMLFGRMAASFRRLTFGQVIKIVNL